MGRRRRQGPALIPDLALNHFANAASFKTRLPKSLSVGAQGDSLTMLCQPEAAEDVDNCEDESVPEHWEDLESSTLMNPASSGPARSIDWDIETRFNHYPHDFWVVLSRHIEPSQVQTFGLINHQTSAIVRSASFWTNLYLRYYSPNVRLPEDLAIGHQHRLRGLKARVIRSLFYLYGPFAQPSGWKKGTEPYGIKNYICTNWWMEPVPAKGYRIFFKFQKVSRRRSKHIKSTRPTKVVDKWSDEDASSEEEYHHRIRPSRVINSYCDLSHNPEASSMLLEIRVDSYSFVPPTMLGLKLFDVKVTVCGVGFRYQKLAMKFVPIHQRTINCDTLICVVLNDVTGLRLVPWYHPAYDKLCRGT